MSESEFYCGDCSEPCKYVKQGRDIGEYWYCKQCRKEEREWKHPGSYIKRHTQNHYSDNEWQKKLMPFDKEKSMTDYGFIYVDPDDYIDYDPND